MVLYKRTNLERADKSMHFLQHLHPNPLFYCLLNAWLFLDCTHCFFCLFNPDGNIQFKAVTISFPKTIRANLIPETQQPNFIHNKTAASGSTMGTLSYYAHALQLQCLQFPIIISANLTNACGLIGQQLHHQPCKLYYHFI